MEKLQEKTKDVKKENNKHTEKKKEVKKSKNIKVKIIVILVIMVLVLLALSTVFGITTMANSKIISGTSINGVDVSGLTKEEAYKKIEEKLQQRQNTTINLKYNDYENVLALDQLDVSANIEDAVNKAESFGREGNVFVNNIDTIKSKFSKRNIEVNVTLNEEQLNNSIQEIGAELPGITKEYAYCIEDNELIITKGVDGIAIDQQTLAQTVKDNLNNFSADVATEMEIPVIEEKAGDIDLDKIYSEIHTEPQDAYMTENPFQVFAEKDGIDFAISMEEAKALLQEDKEEYVIPLKITKPKVTVASFGDKAFPNRLATFSTSYAASNVGRTTNLRIACNKINGYVLQPGETFSYNKVLGKRTVENGYKEAAIFTTNGVENGLGGGICQISSTLYNSVVMANLGIVERHNHGYVTSYLKPGLDATVSYGSLDFKFKNTRSYPIQIKASISGGIATVSIYGRNEETEYNIKLTSVVTATIPYDNDIQEDPTLEAGKEVVVKKGTTGYKSVSYKEVYTKSGKLVSKTQISSDTYRTIKGIIRVGTGAKQQPTNPTTPKPPEKEPTPSTNPSQSQEPEPSTSPSETPGDGNTTTPDPSEGKSDP